MNDLFQNRLVSSSWESATGALRSWHETPTYLLPENGGEFGGPNRWVPHCGGELSEDIVYPTLITTLHMKGEHKQMNIQSRKSYIMLNILIQQSRLFDDS